MSFTPSCPAKRGTKNPPYGWVSISCFRLFPWVLRLPRGVNPTKETPISVNASYQPSSFTPMSACAISPVLYFCPPLMWQTCHLSRLTWLRWNSCPAKMESHGSTSHAQSSPPIILTLCEELVNLHGVSNVRSREIETIYHQSEQLFSRLDGNFYRLVWQLPA